MNSKIIAKTMYAIDGRNYIYSTIEDAEAAIEAQNQVKVIDKTITPDYKVGDIVYGAFLDAVDRFRIDGIYEQTEENYDEFGQFNGNLVRYTVVAFTNLRTHDQHSLSTDYIDPKAEAAKLKLNWRELLTFEVTSDE